MLQWPVQWLVPVGMKTQATSLIQLDVNVAIPVIAIGSGIRVQWQAGPGVRCTCSLRRGHYFCRLVLTPLGHLADECNPVLAGELRMPARNWSASWMTMARGAADNWLQLANMANP